jgi:hypothetical protein
MTPVEGENSTAPPLSAGNYCGICESKRQIIIPADQDSDSLEILHTAVEYVFTAFHVA